MRADGKAMKWRGESFSAISMIQETLPNITRQHKFLPSNGI